jgi:hypothetical protein
MFSLLDSYIFLPPTSALRSKIMNELASDRTGDTQGVKPCALSSTSDNDVLGKRQAVQAADKSKKSQKPGADKNANASKRHKQEPAPEEPVPGECLVVDNVLGKHQAVQAADKSKKELDQKRGAGKSAKAPKRHKKDPLPGECPTFVEVRVDKLPCIFTRSYEGTDDDDEVFLQFARSEAYEGVGHLQDCQLEPDNPAKGDCCSSHTSLVIDRFVCDLCIDRGNEISDDYWC